MVVGTDYAGLGVPQIGDYQIMAHLAATNDILFSVKAARQVFPVLSSDFVVIGPSQDGGAAWAAAQRQATAATTGYLDAFAVVPVTNLIELPDTGNPLMPLLPAYATPAIKAAFPDFEDQTLFPEQGWLKYQLD